MIKYSSPGNNHTVLPSFSLRMAEARPESHAAAMEASSTSRPCGFGGENKEGLQVLGTVSRTQNKRVQVSKQDYVHLSPFPHLLSPGEPGDGDLAASVRPAPSVPSGKLTSAAHPLPVEPLAP